MPDSAVLQALYDADYGPYQPGAVVARASLQRRIKWMVAEIASVPERHSTSEAVRRAAGALATVLELVGARSVPVTTSIPQSLSSDARILDYGCGAGWWLRVMRDHGFSGLHGYDIDHPGLDDLARAGITVLRGPCSLPRASFDLIRLEHVLEHLVDPVGALSTLREALHPQGEIVLSVPNYASWSRRVSGKDWSYLSLPHHLNHFNEGSLRSVAARAGLRVERAALLPIWEAGGPALRRSLHLAASVPLESGVIGQLAKLGYHAWGRATRSGDFLTAVLRVAA
jgi:2-polyprenyl-3-methyl-5-hydroxy-6-metoxy-1,4-benzoquinol methylase